MNELTKYARLPPRLAKMWPTTAQPEDKYGSEDRLAAIVSVLRGRKLGKIVDIGGNAGFFCLSLVDAGLADEAIIYDFSQPAVAAGKKMARALDLSDKVDLIVQAADLDFLSTLAPTDTIICLNLLHHAGTSFDVEQVERSGWGSYAESWMREMRARSELSIVGIGFEPTKPKHWEVPHHARPAEFAQLSEKAGWSILYDANVGDIRSMGVEAANGRYTAGGARLAHEKPLSSMERLTKKAARLTGLKFLRPRKPRSKLGRYHLYILE